MRNDEERAFLDAYDPAAYERLSVAVDVALVTADGGALRTLLVRRDAHPFRGSWALPGGFVGPREALEDAAARVLRGKARLATDVYFEQLFTFGAPERDPRTRVISVAYCALVDAARFRAAVPPDDVAGGLAVATLEVPWAGESGGPVGARDAEGRALPLAFDHADILGLVVKRLRGKLDYAPVGFQLLPPSFTLLELQRVHETVLGRRVNKDSFRRRLLATGQIEATGQSQAEGRDDGRPAHRPAALYRLVARQPAL